MNVKIKTSSEHGFIISSVWHLSIITLYLTHGNYKDVLNVLHRVHGLEVRGIFHTVRVRHLPNCRNSTAGLSSGRCERTVKLASAKATSAPLYLPGK